MLSTDVPMLNAGARAGGELPPGAGGRAGGGRHVGGRRARGAAGRGRGRDGRGCAPGRSTAARAGCAALCSTCCACIRAFPPLSHAGAIHAEPRSRMALPPHASRVRLLPQPARRITHACRWGARRPCLHASRLNRAAMRRPEPGGRGHAHVCARGGAGGAGRPAAPARARRPDRVHRQRRAHARQRARPPAPAPRVWPCVGARPVRNPTQAMHM